MRLKNNRLWLRLNIIRIWKKENKKGLKKKLANEKNIFLRDIQILKIYNVWNIIIIISDILYS